MPRPDNDVSPPALALDEKADGVGSIRSGNKNLRKKHLQNLKVSRGFVANHDPAVQEVFESFQRHGQESGLRSQGVRLKISKGMNAQLMNNQATAIMASRAAGTKKVKR